MWPAIAAICACVGPVVIYLVNRQRIWQARLTKIRALIKQMEDIRDKALEHDNSDLVTHCATSLIRMRSEEADILQQRPANSLR